MKIEDIAGDFIGKEVRITESLNLQIIGVSGVVIDETKNTFKIISGNIVNIFPKEGSIFQFNNNSGSIKVNGNYIKFSPENRLKESKRIIRAIKRSERIW
ncbi:MAG: ribonuclease P protein component 1 [Thermoplasmataceae archaeon]